MQPAYFKNLEVTQASADAFAEASELTGITPESGYVWELDRLEVHIPDTDNLKGISADSDITIALTRESQASMINLANIDALCIMEKVFPLVTSGLAVVDGVWIYQFPPGVVVVKDEIYISVDSSGTGATFHIKARLYYRLTRMAEIDILRMLSNG